MNIYQETTPLKSEDIFVVLDSINNGFDYPIHNHPEFELNLVIGMSGSRIIGDSIERYADVDLVLIGPYLYHKWDGDLALQHDGHPYRVITIQFGMSLIGGQFFQKKQFGKIRTLITNASEGILFFDKTRTEAIELMISLTEEKGFTNTLTFMKLLNLLSESLEFRFLSNEGFSSKVLSTHSNRLQIAYNYILKNFQEINLKISDVAAQVNMSESSFSHFFRKYAFKSFTQFLMDIRIGHSCKLLLDTDETIGQICFKSGFNNLANFNRLFKKYRLSTPVRFRQNYLSKTNFDWAHQITPMQFVPFKTGEPAIKPRIYATKLIHV
jgi:AraC-like DNA-binding protein